MSPLFRRTAVALSVLLLLALYGWEAHGRRDVAATPLNQADQAAYLSYARRMHETHYAVAGDRNRMPLFPFLLSLVYRPGMTEGEFLDRAQQFNINMSILLLALLFLIFRRFFASFYALALLATTAFGVFVYRAGIVQAEPLFYFLGFCAFLFLLEMLTAPRWWLAVLAGAFTALAYLTKASILAMLPIWAVVFVAQTIWEWGRRFSAADARRRLGHFLMVMGAFAAAVCPYERTSKELYGQYFFNVNSAYYMWCDSWPEALAFTEAQRSANLAPDQVPSPAKYWREHSLGQIAARMLHGMKTLLTRSAKLPGYYKFVALFVGAIGLLAVRRSSVFARLSKEHAFAAGFCFLFLLSYVLLYAWYDAVVTDSRFILSLFLPFVFAGSKVLIALDDDRSLTILGRRFGFVQLFALALSALALIDIGYNALRVSRVMT